MRPVRLGLMFAVIAICVFATGCGGAKEKGKNQDFDRPKQAEKK